MANDLQTMFYISIKYIFSVLRTDEFITINEYWVVNILLVHGMTNYCCLLFMCGCLVDVLQACRRLQVNLTRVCVDLLISVDCHTALCYYSRYDGVLFYILLFLFVNHILQHDFMWPWIGRVWPACAEYGGPKMSCIQVKLQ